MPDPMSGGRAIFGRLAQLAPHRSAQSAVAQFHVMERSARGRGYLERAGVSASRQTQRAWLSEDRTPSPANRRAIGAAYKKWSAGNLAGKTGRTVEIYPAPAGAQDKWQRPVRQVTVSPEEWDELITAWQDGDTEAADATWKRIVDSQIMDSPPGRAYHDVSHVWFGAGQ